MLAQFRNEYASVSRLQMFDQCPRSFAFRYVERVEPDPGDDSPTEFGKLNHQCLESAMRWVLANEFSGKFPVDQAVAALRKHWPEFRLPERCYEECLAILRDYAAMRGRVNWLDILGIEEPIDEDLGDGVRLRGAMDFVFRHGPDVVVEDYKTNRVLFTQEDLDTSLQASTYLWVARRRWPGARAYRFVFTMLRHDGGRPLWTQRTEKQLDDVPMHLVDSVRRTERGEYPAKLNANCRYCAYGSRCEKLQKAVSGTERWPDPEKLSLEEVLQHRYQSNLRAGYLYKKKNAYDKALMVELQRRGPFNLGPYRVGMSAKRKDIDYPRAAMVELFARALGISEKEVLERVSSVDSDKVDRLLSQVPDEERLILKAQLQAIKRERVLEHRVDVSMVKGRGDSSSH